MRHLQAYLGHRNIQHTLRYTELPPSSGAFGGLSRMSAPLAVTFLSKLAIHWGPQFVCRHHSKDEQHHKIYRRSNCHGTSRHPS
jgi:hypothetical protein